MVKKIPPMGLSDAGDSFHRLVHTTRQQSDPAEATKLLEIRVLKAFANRLIIDSKERISSDHHHRKKTPRKPVFKKGKNSTNTKTKRKRKMEGIEAITADLSSELKAKIAEKGGTNVELVITKPMFMTDLNPHHDRLTIPLKQVKSKSFPTEEEEEGCILDKGKDGVLDVKSIEPCGTESDLKFIKWKLKSSYSYALRSGWRDVVKRNRNSFFNLDDVVQLWSFRVHRQLWFALQKVRDAPIIL